LDVVYLPHNLHGDGGRIYALGPTLARGQYIGNLDEDNFLALSHVRSLVGTIAGGGLDWAFALRTLTMRGVPLAHDRCESLGPRRRARGARRLCAPAR
jgi:hypothetical protein